MFMEQMVVSEDHWINVFEKDLWRPSIPSPPQSKLNFKALNRLLIVMSSYALFKEILRMRQPLQTRCSSAWWLLLWSFHFKINKSIKMKNKIFSLATSTKAKQIFCFKPIFCSWKPTQHKLEAAKRNVILIIMGKWKRFVNRYRIKDCLRFTYQEGFPSNSILESLFRNTSPSDSVTNQPPWK